MENNVIKKDEFKKVITRSIIALFLAVAFTLIIYLLYKNIYNMANNCGWFRTDNSYSESYDARESLLINMRTALLVVFILSGCLIGAYSLYSVINFSFQLNVVSKRKFIIGVSVSILVFLVILTLYILLLIFLLNYNVVMH